MDSFWSVSGFWALAALFVAIALAFVLPPLLRRREGPAVAGRRSINIAVYRDQLKEMETDHRNGLLTDEQFAIAKVELEARLAQDALEAEEGPAVVSKRSRRLGFALAGLIPLAAFGLYVLLGNPSAMLQSSAGQVTAEQQQGHDMQAMLQKIEAKAKANPDDGESWFMLARTYSAIGRWADAEQAFATASKLLPKEAAVLSRYAEAVAINAGEQLKGRPMELVQQALALNPGEPKALELAGVNAFREENYAKAVDYWQRLVQQMPPDDPYAQEIQGALMEAQRRAGGGVQALDNLSEQPAKAPAAHQASVTGTLSVSPALRDKVNADDVIFVFARPAGGSGAPLAALRIRGDALPAAFQLDDSLAMMPSNKLSDHETVTLTARIAKSGGPEAKTGDLEGSLKLVKVGAQDVKLVIDTVRK